MKNNDSTLAYLAGVMDSDGSIGIRKDTYGMRVRRDQSIPNYYPRLLVSQTSPEAVVLFKRTFGGMICVTHPQIKARSPLLRWEIRYGKAEEAIIKLLPFLRIKQQHAQLILKLQKMKRIPQLASHNVKALTRWGTSAVFKRRMRSTSQLAAMERAYLKMRSLNDTRSNPEFWPITDRQRDALKINENKRRQIKLGAARRLPADIREKLRDNIRAEK